MDLLDKPIVLRLNKVWQVIGHSTIRDALTAMNSGDDYVKAAVAINVDYPKLDDDSWDMDNPNFYPTPWEEWVTLPVRPFDDFIRLTGQRMVRVPTIIISQKYAHVPKIRKHPTRANIRARDGGVCQVSGRVLSKNEGNVDHMIPRCRGGKNTWENMIWMDKKLNSMKNNKTIEEMGWKPLKKPIAPKEVPVSATITTPEHPDWRFFI